MSGSNASSKTFKGVLDDVQTCIGTLSRELSRLSEEHEREVSNLYREQAAKMVESPYQDACRGPRKPSPPLAEKAFAQESTLIGETSNELQKNDVQAAESNKVASRQASTEFQYINSNTSSAAPSVRSQTMCDVDQVRMSSASDVMPAAARPHFPLDAMRESTTAKSRRRLFFQLASARKTTGSESQSSSSAHSSRSSTNSEKGEMVRFRFSEKSTGSPSFDSKMSCSFSLADQGQPLFDVLPVWRADQDIKVLPMLRSRSWKQVDTFDNLEIDEDDDNYNGPCCLDHLVSTPSSTQRLLWDILGMLIIGYDLIFIPLQAFDPPASTVTEFLSWLTTCYWTLDIPFSFLVGFHTKGVIEMRAAKIAPKYVKGWFLFDFLVVSVDWAMSILLRDVQVRSPLRFLRMIRLLRLFKVVGLLNDMMKRIKSESLLIMLGIVKLIIFIMSVNHLIACGFYWVGEKSEKFVGDTWVKENDLVGASLGYKYTTALHWSLTQFTPASMEVVPRNTLERTYNVITLIFAMVTFSSFVSSITNAMTRLRNLNSERMEQHSVLRAYLVQNSISADLTTQIYGFLEKSVENKSKRVHTSDVIILRRLPKSLQDSLQSEVYSPILTVHPFFSCFNQVYPKGMLRLYRFALEEGSVSTGQELFTMGEAADRMHFIVKGLLSYTLGVMGEGYDSSSTVKVGSWLCEQALWIEWRHCGQLVAVQHSEVLDIKASKFQSIVRRELVGVSEPSKYAELFAEYADYLARRKRLTDLCHDHHAIEEVAHEAWASAMVIQRNSVENARSQSLKFMGSSVIQSIRSTFQNMRGSLRQTTRIA